MSSNILGRVQKLIFENIKESDHKLVILTFKNKVEMGPGIWIFNNTLLSDPSFTNEVKAIINTYKNENVRTKFPSKIIAWDFLKMEIKNFSKSFSKIKAKKERGDIEIVRNKLEILESLPKQNISREVENEIVRLKKLDLDFNQNKLRGCHIRSRVPHMEEGEGNISYFTRLEKRKGEENMIFSLENRDGIIEEGNENLKNIIYDFYLDLYTKEPEDEAIQNIFLNKVDKMLTTEEK